MKINYHLKKYDYKYFRKYHLGNNLAKVLSNGNNQVNLIYKDKENYLMLS